MATKAHQFIADLIAQRMQLDGYEIVSFEGNSQIPQNIKFLPPTIKRHRPDLLGLKNGSLAVGEAKTASDIGIRTHEQLEDYINCCKSANEHKIKVYLGIPLSIEEKVHKLLNSLGGYNCVEILSIPDRLLPTYND